MIANLMLSLLAALLVQGPPPPAENAQGEKKPAKKGFPTPLLSVNDNPIDPADKPPAAEKSRPPKIDLIIAHFTRTSPEVRMAEADVLIAQAKLDEAKAAAAARIVALYDNIVRMEAEIELGSQHLKLRKETILKAQVRVMELRMGKASLDAIQNQEIKILALDKAYEEAKIAHDLKAIDLPRLQDEWNRLLQEASVAQQPPQAAAMRNASPPGGMGEMGFIGPGAPTSAANTGQSIAKTESLIDAALYEVMTTQVDLLDMQNVLVQDAVAAMFKPTGKSFLVKYPSTFNPKLMKDTPRITLSAGSMPLHSWLQLVADEVSDDLGAAITGERKPRLDFYVREYGLQLAARQDAAPGAIPLAEAMKRPAPKK